MCQLVFFTFWHVFVRVYVFMCLCVCFGCLCLLFCLLCLCHVRVNVVDLFDVHLSVFVRASVGWSWLWFAPFSAPLTSHR